MICFVTMRYILIFFFTFHGCWNAMVFVSSSEVHSHGSRNDRPMDTAADLTNDLGVCVLQFLSSTTRGNVAFSPYGLSTVAVLLFEGATGHSAHQLQKLLRLPWNVLVTKIGFRDLHRHLKGYFMSDGFLAGLTFSRDDICMLPRFRQILLFYGFEPEVSLPDSCSRHTTTTTTTAFPVMNAPAENVTIAGVPTTEGTTTANATMETLATATPEAAPPTIASEVPPIAAQETPKPTEPAEPAEAPKPTTAAEMPVPESAPPATTESLPPPSPPPSTTEPPPPTSPPPATTEPPPPPSPPPATTEPPPPPSPPPATTKPPPPATTEPPPPPPATPASATEPPMTEPAPKEENSTPSTTASPTDQNVEVTTEESIEADANKAEAPPTTTEERLREELRLSENMRESTVPSFVTTTITENSELHSSNVELTTTQQSPESANSATSLTPMTETPSQTQKTMDFKQSVTIPSSPPESTSARSSAIEILEKATPTDIMTSGIPQTTLSSPGEGILDVSNDSVPLTPRNEMFPEQNSSSFDQITTQKEFEIPQTQMSSLGDFIPTTNRNSGTLDPELNFLDKSITTEKESDALLMETPAEKMLNREVNFSTNKDFDQTRTTEEEPYVRTETPGRDINTPEIRDSVTTENYESTQKNSSDVMENKVTENYKGEPTIGLTGNPTFEAETELSSGFNRESTSELPLNTEVPPFVTKTQSSIPDLPRNSILITDRIINEDFSTTPENDYSTILSRNMPTITSIIPQELDFKLVNVQNKSEGINNETPLTIEDQLPSQKPEFNINGPKTVTNFSYLPKTKFDGGKDKDENLTTPKSYSNGEEFINQNLVNELESTTSSYSQDRDKYLENYSTTYSPTTKGQNGDAEFSNFNVITDSELETTNKPDKNAGGILEYKTEISEKFLTSTPSKLFEETNGPPVLNDLDHTEVLEITRSPSTEDQFQFFDKLNDLTTDFPTITTPHSLESTIFNPDGKIFTFDLSTGGEQSTSTNFEQDQPTLKDLDRSIFNPTESPLSEFDNLFNQNKDLPPISRDDPEITKDTLVIVEEDIEREPQNPKPGNMKVAKMLGARFPSNANVPIGLSRMGMRKNLVKPSSFQVPISTTYTDKFRNGNPSEFHIKSKSVAISAENIDPNELIRHSTHSPELNRSSVIMMKAVPLGFSGKGEYDAELTENYRVDESRLRMNSAAFFEESKNSKNIESFAVESNTVESDVVESSSVHSSYSHSHVRCGRRKRGLPPEKRDIDETSSLSHLSGEKSDDKLSSRSTRSIDWQDVPPIVWNLMKHKMTSNNDLRYLQAKNRYDGYSQVPETSIWVSPMSSHQKIVPVMNFAAILPYAYIPSIHSYVAELPLDNPRYALMIVLPAAGKTVNHVLNRMTQCGIRSIHSQLRPFPLHVIVPTFRIFQQLDLSPALYHFGVEAIFDPYRAHLNYLSYDPYLHVRNVEQVVTLSARKYDEHLKYNEIPIHQAHEKFYAANPFIYFVVDLETTASLIAGVLNDPLRP